jgi:hypothetical protein
MTIHVSCHSGGETSGIVGYEMVKRFGAENCILINHNINPWVEHWDIKRFKQEMSVKVGVPITYANHPDWETKDQFDVCMDAKAFKVDFHPLCTNRLKTAPFHHWLGYDHPVNPDTGRNDDVIIYYGFEAGETDRINRRRSILAEKGYRTCFPLAEWSGVIKSTREIGVEPPKTYQIWKHANCVGCLRAGQQHWYVVYCRRRDVWEKAKHAESVIGYSILRVNNKPAFLVELEPKFETMRLLGISADEKMHPATFWAKAKKILGAQPVEDLAGCGT